MSSDIVFSGRCLCGALAWRGAGPCLWTGHCHCESCRRACSAGFASWLCLPRAAVIWQGRRSFYHSSPDVQRGFCQCCGAPVSFETDKRPVEIDLYAASLIDPEQFVPHAHYHYAERQNWIKLDDGLPKYCAGETGPADPAGQV
jgi:hypothetical protein